MIMMKNSNLLAFFILVYAVLANSFNYNHTLQNSILAFDQSNVSSLRYPYFNKQRGLQITLGCTYPAVYYTKPSVFFYNMNLMDTITITLANLAPPHTLSPSSIAFTPNLYTTKSGTNDPI